MRLATLLASVILVLAFVVPGAASGATVQMVSLERPIGELMVFEAAAGEVNEVTASDAPGGIEFHDAAAFVAAGDGCVAVDVHTVLCGRPDGYLEVHIRAGDLDDTVSAANSCTACEGYPFVTVRGGAGDDTVSAGTGSKLEAYGGVGDDTLTGGPYDDVLNGGPGADRMDGADHASGDIVSYAGHRVPVTVTIDADPSDGAEGEGDSVLNFEGAVGGAGGARRGGGAPV